LDKAKYNFDRNMDKFKLYAMRNIFVPAAPDSSKVGLVADEQLQQLREQYLSIQADLREVTDSCEDTDLLLKDMRSALFTLRVGAQAFDEVDIHPIADTVANAIQHRDKLLLLCKEANGKCMIM
jgi:hypothetical protein